jgi:Flp pilus assembly pilin Flp
MNTRKQKGQGLVEYALIIALVALAAVAFLALFGPQVMSLYDGALTRLFPGPIAGANAARSGGGTGNDISVTVTISGTLPVTVTDSQSGQTQTISCASSCLFTFSGVGNLGGQLKITTTGGTYFASYGAKQ